MGMGICQLKTMLNLASNWPERVSSSKGYSDPYPIGVRSRTTNLMAALQKRGLVDNDPQYDDDEYMIQNGWRITMLGFYYLLNMEKHLSMWQREARKFWRREIRPFLNSFIPLTVQEQLREYSMSQMTPSMLRVSVRG